MSLAESGVGVGIARCAYPGGDTSGDLYAPVQGTPGCWAIQFADGSGRQFGNGEPVFTIKVFDDQYWGAIQRNGTYAAALGFIKGEIEIKGDLIEAVRWWSSQKTGRMGDRLVTVVARLAPSRVESFLQSKERAAENIEFHYDRSTEFYKCFLDANLVYSCAYFRRADDSIDEAQTAKLNYICRKLELGLGDRFLDIGCGWGGLVLEAARYGANATGCTLSNDQFEFAQERAAREGWAERVRIQRSDYRDVAGAFSKIASIGMFEHVGRRRIPQYFRRVAELMTDDGLFLNHGIVRPRSVPEGPETVFIRNHVFPGSELPHLPDVVAAAEDAGFTVLDVESLGSHYALTCRKWVDRLQMNRQMAMSLAGPETYRTWLLYLTACSLSFDAGYMDVCQLLLARRGSGRRRHLTRAHLYDRSLAAAAR